MLAGFAAHTSTSSRTRAVSGVPGSGTGFWCIGQSSITYRPPGSQTGEEAD